MTNRFRLSYLKSPESKKPDVDGLLSSYASENGSLPSLFPEKKSHFETAATEAILKQAKADLKDPNPKIRVLGVRYYLEHSCSSISMSLLQEILSDQDADVRAEALHALIKFQSPIVSHLLKKYLKDQEPKVRIAALRGLFRSQENVDLNMLFQLLSDESPWVRRKIATRLGWDQVEGALPILMELSRDQNAMVRKSAISSLTILYPENAENRLMEAIADSDPDLRKWAKTTLEKIVTKPRGKERVLPSHSETQGSFDRG